MNIFLLIILIGALFVCFPVLVAPAIAVANAVIPIATKVVERLFHTLLSFPLQVYKLLFHDIPGFLKDLFKNK